MVKRIRKYHGSIVITTQNLNDFTGTEDIKKKTTVMINNTQYSLILNLAPQDLKDVAELYRSYGGSYCDWKQLYNSSKSRSSIILLFQVMNDIVSGHCS